MKAINLKLSNLSREKTDLVNAMIADLQGKSFDNTIESTEHFVARGTKKVTSNEHFIARGEITRISNDHFIARGEAPSPAFSQHFIARSDKKA